MSTFIISEKLTKEKKKQNFMIGRKQQCSSQSVNRHTIGSFIGINCEEPLATLQHLTHQTLTKNADTWFQQFDLEKPNTIRLLVQNIGRIDIHPCESVKLAALHEFMEEHQVYMIAAIMESNVAA